MPNAGVALQSSGQAAATHWLVVQMEPSGGWMRWKHGFYLLHCLKKLQICCQASLASMLPSTNLVALLGIVPSAAAAA
jgi:hypothetical protein